MKANSNEIEDKEESDGMKLGIAEESKEHPWLTAVQIKHLVSDHLAMDPEYYGGEEDD